MDDSLISGIRGAVAAGQFAKARKLWESYAARLSDDLRFGRMTASRMAEMQALAEWCRLATLAERAHTQDRLNALLASRNYAPQPAARPSRISACL